MLKIDFINTLVFRINSNIITVFLHIVVLSDNFKCFNISYSFLSKLQKINLVTKANAYIIILT